MIKKRKMDKQNKQKVAVVLFIIAILISIISIVMIVKTDFEPVRNTVTYKETNIIKEVNQPTGGAGVSFNLLPNGG